MKIQQNRIEKRSLTEKVLCLFIKKFLNPNPDAGEMITVFDLIEHNPDGRTRIERLIEEDCVRKLTEQEIEEAIELLEDYKFSE